MHKVTHFELAYHRVRRLYVEMAPKMPIRMAVISPCRHIIWSMNVSINDSHHWALYYYINVPNRDHVTQLI